MASKSPAPDRYALVGHPVEHSRSPLIHQLFARQTGQRLTYELIDAEPAEFETAVRGFGAAGGKGLNVTVPHKEAAFALASTVSEAAQIAGAVNTISFLEGGKLRGDNTDGVGLVRDLTVNQRLELEGRSVLVLGAGGAARGIIGPLLGESLGELMIANRTKQRADDLVARFPKRAELHSTSFDDLASLPAYDLVINATSAGIKGETPPFPASLIGSDTVCYDLVYSLNDTPFAAWARAHGAALALQGWGMLIEQAAESFHIWRRIRPDTQPLLKQLAR
jgi:shikimate dehydrogenase